MSPPILAAMLTAALVALAQGQTVTAVKLQRDKLEVGAPAAVILEFKDNGNPWCGLMIDWGNGERKAVRIGDDALRVSPIHVSKSFDSAGSYIVSVKGEYLSRGLKSAPGCDVSASRVQFELTIVNAVDATSDRPPQAGKVGPESRGR